MDRNTSINIDEDLWKKAKIYAIQNDMTLKQLIEKILREEIDGGNKGT